MNLEYIRRVERWNYGLGFGLAVVSMAVFSRPGAFGVLVGVAISCLNFSFMRRMGERWMRVSPERRQLQVVLLFPKMMALFAAVALALFFLPISAIGLAIGFSVFLLSIGIETIRYITTPSAGSPSDPMIDDTGERTGGSGDPGN